MTAKWTKVFLYVSSFQLTTPKSAAYAQEYRPKSDAANLDKRRREPGTGLTSDKKKARGELQNDGGSGEISHEFPPTRRPQKNTSCFTGARLAMFGRSARARATDSGSETLHVPTMGSKQPRTALVLCRGAYLRPSFKKFPRSRFFISNK